MDLESVTPNEKGLVNLFFNSSLKLTANPYHLAQYSNPRYLVVEAPIKRAHLDHVLQMNQDLCHKP